MISKQRLKELIEQGATIWCPYYMFDEEGIQLDNKDYIDGEILYVVNEVWKDNFRKQPLKLEYLFETEEDARWDLEMTATRTETLKMPNYEEFCEFDELIPNFRISFISKDEENCSLYFFNGICESDPKEIILWNQDIDDKIIFEKVATKENYIEACKLCLRLFKGKEV